MVLEGKVKKHVENVIRLIKADVGGVVGLKVRFLVCMMFLI